MTTVLVVDDEPIVREVVARYLKREGYRTLEAADGNRARELVEREAPNLVVLDLMIPGTDGLALCRWIRSSSQLPVIMLTARGEEADRIVGLELGADDYVTKPFSPRELTARVAALLRRVHRPAATTSGAPLKYGPLTIDVVRHAVDVDGVDVRLTAKEFLLLQYLVEHRGRVLSRDLLLTDVWGYAYTGGTRTVDVHIRRLREKLPFLTDAIVTIKQFGYRLEDK
jgi:DNA-binding response OmpR family regulator